ncbi:MAG: hypothetical protein E7158_05340 [Firmicutes bacterium]|nr:hypothetical protein [Bacillota bacterium]
METKEEIITRLSKLKFEEFDKELEKSLLNKSTEEKLAFLHMLKMQIKEVKSDLVVLKRITEDISEKIYLKAKIKKLKQKITIINYKFSLINSEKEQIVKKDILNNTQKRIKEDILNEEDVSSYDIKDQVIVLDHLIFEDFDEETYDIIQKYAHEISINLANYLSKEEGFKEFYTLLNDLKNRVTRSIKDSKERNVLKSMFNDFKDAYKVYKNKLEEENKKGIEVTSYFEIINYFLTSEDNYNYIKKIVEKDEQAVNTRYNNKHIVFYILECYIENFKRMVTDKNSDYLNLDYIEQVYYLFTKNHLLKLSREERELIDLKIKEFEEYIDKTLIKQKRKNYAKSICKKMKSSKFYKETPYYNFPEYNDDYLNYLQLMTTKNMEVFIKNENNVKDAYLYDGNAYNIETLEDGRIKLNMYAISYYHFITKDSDIDAYLLKCEMSNEKVDEFFKKGLVFKNNEKYPVINYELEFYPSGKLCGLKAYEDVVSLKLINNEKYDQLDELYKKSKTKNNDQNSGLNTHFENMLERAYLKFLKDNGFPFIYYGKTMPNQKEIDRVINDLSGDLYTMDKHSYENMMNIISNESDKYHYSIAPIKNAVYELNLLDPFSYLGIENQRMLADLHFNNRKYSSKDRLNKLKILYKYKYYRQVLELNANIDYVDTNSIKQKKGRIKVRYY